MKNFALCQKDNFKNSEYASFAMKRNARFGFVCVSDTFDFVSFIAFDEAAELDVLFDNPNANEPGHCDYNELEEVNVGESYSFDGDCVFTRLW